MATVIDNLPEDGRNAPKSSYPWDQWMDGRVWKIRHTNDFKCTPSGMAQNLYYKAKKTGRDVTVRQGRRDPDGRRILIFQFSSAS